jgi:microcystin-dependent protein
MSQPFLGEIRPFGFNFAPRGWAMCAGQILSIAQNTALFSLLGTTYGGNGQTTFALPDLRARAAVGAGQGPGLSEYDLGEMGGTTSVTLLSNQMPSHTHLPLAVSGAGNRRDPFTIEPPTVGHRWAGSAHDQYSAFGPDTTMAPNLIGIAGGSQPHANESPYLTVNFCISLEGIFPSRN